jgi:hypothetical protein
MHRILETIRRHIAARHWRIGHGTRLSWDLIA